MGEPKEEEKKNTIWILMYLIMHNLFIFTLRFIYGYSVVLSCSELVR